MFVLVCIILYCCLFQYHSFPPQTLFVPSRRLQQENLVLQEPGSRHQTQQERKEASRVACRCKRQTSNKLHHSALVCLGCRQGQPKPQQSPQEGRHLLSTCILSMPMSRAFASQKQLSGTKRVVSGCLCQGFLRLYPERPSTCFKVIVDEGTCSSQILRCCAP